MQAKLNAMLQRAKRWKLQPFSEDLFSLNALGSCLLFIHYDEESKSMIFYSPLLRLTESEKTSGLLQKLLAFNLPAASPLGLRVSLDTDGQVWTALNRSLSFCESCDIDALIERYIAGFIKISDELSESSLSLTQQQETSVRAPLSVNDYTVEAYGSHQMLWG